MYIPTIYIPKKKKEDPLKAEGYPLFISELESKLNYEADELRDKIDAAYKPGSDTKNIPAYRAELAAISITLKTIKKYT